MAGVLDAVCLPVFDVQHFPKLPTFGLGCFSAELLINPQVLAATQVPAIDSVPFLRV